MRPGNPPPRSRGLALTLGWRRLLVAFVASTVLGLLLTHGFPAVPTWRVILRECVVGFAALVAFGLFEQWSARLPSWLAPWVLQVLCIALATKRRRFTSRAAMRCSR